MKRRFVFTPALPALIILLILLSPGATPRTFAQGIGGSGPNIGASVTPVTFNGDLRTLPVSTQSLDSHVFLPGRFVNAQSTVQGPDLAVQAAAPTRQMPTPNLTFKGLDFAAWGAGWPPDTNGAVGPNHFIQTVNTSIGIYNKSGTRLYAARFDNFWTAAGSTGTPCTGHNYGDPVVIYDALADRWIITDFAFAVDSAGNTLPPYYECIAVSKTGDPVSGGWYFYPLLADNSDFSDYPKFGVWPDAYYMTANMFSGAAPDEGGDGNSTVHSPTAFIGARVWALDRAKMINGQSITPIYFDTGPSYGGLLPSNLLGALPPSGSPNYVAAIDSPSSNTIHVWKFHFDPVTLPNSWFGASSSNSNPVDVAVAAFVQPCNSGGTRACVPQKGSTEKVDSLGDRLLMQLQYRNLSGVESLWVAHTVANSTSVGTPTGIRWYQLDVTGGTPSLVQQSTFNPGDGLYRWLPSLAVDKFGNMAVGYSTSSSTTYPALAYTGRLSSDPAGTLGQGENMLFAGTGSQLNGYNRWGDYSAMSIDPTDDCTFWYTNEYYASTGRSWQTRIGYFRFPQCGPGGPITVDENAPSVQYDSWQGVSDAQASGGSYRASNLLNAKATLSFSGASARWYYKTDADEGQALVTIDGVNKGTINLYSASPVYNQSTLFSGLANTNHTLAITVKTGKIVIDKVVAGATTFEDTSSKYKWSTWVTASNASYFGGTARTSSTLNDTVTLQFTGTGVNWIGVKGPGYGKAQVVLDGAQTYNVDLYAASIQYQAQLLAIPGLTSGPHTLVIKVLHTKNASATGYKIAVDWFQITQ
ncbi:MAG: hypothetical protein WCF84_20980 [Anaerolineae bacterium]